MEEFFVKETPSRESLSSLDAHVAVLANPFEPLRLTSPKLVWGVPLVPIAVPNQCAAVKGCIAMHSKLQEL